ncbi:leucine-rich repeat protein SHOC-2-like, partial [Trifolium medium]|nr:leucine-rich repeat protein SHOC-2-like [Trifolium medium]
AESFAKLCFVYGGCLGIEGGSRLIPAEYIDIAVLTSCNWDSCSRSGFDKQVPSIVASSSLVHVDKDVSAKAFELFTRDVSYVSKSTSKSPFYPNGSRW